MRTTQHFLLQTSTLCTVLACLLMACSGPRPILYPNDYLNRVGQDQAERDIAECRQLADDHISSHTGEELATNTTIGAGVGAASGAVIGAVSGSAGRGAAIGAASGATGGFLRGLFRSSQPSRAYRNFVDTCLKKKGYEPTGWD